MKRMFLTAVVCVFFTTGMACAQTPSEPPGGHPPGPGRPMRMDPQERKEVMDIFMQMRRIEERVVNEDEEVHRLFVQFREKLNQKLDANAEYQELCKRLEEKGIKPPRSRKGRTDEPRGRKTGIPNAR